MPYLTSLGLTAVFALPVLSELVPLLLVAKEVLKELLKDRLKLDFILPFYSTPP